MNINTKLAVLRAYLRQARINAEQASEDGKAQRDWELGKLAAYSDAEHRLGAILDVERIGERPQ